MQPAGPTYPARRPSGNESAYRFLDKPSCLFKVIPRAQLVRHGGEIVADVHRDDVGAYFGESDCVRTALTARGTGDENNPAVEQTHDPHSFLLDAHRGASAALICHASKHDDTCEVDRDIEQYLSN